MARTFDGPPVFCLLGVCEISVVAIRTKGDLERPKEIRTVFCMMHDSSLFLCHQVHADTEVKYDQCLRASQVSIGYYTWRQ